MTDREPSLTDGRPAHIDQAQRADDIERATVEHRELVPRLGEAAVERDRQTSISPRNTAGALSTSAMFKHVQEFRTRLSKSSRPRVTKHPN